MNEISREEIEKFQKLQMNEKFNKIMEMAPSEFTFLGVTYNLNTRERSVAAKTWGKLEAVTQVIFPEGRFNPQTTPRHLAMLTGLLGWIRRVCNIRNTDFNTSRNLAELAYALWERPDLWDKPLQKIAFMFQPIFEIYKAVQTRKCTPIYPPLPTASNTLICITDASAYGWGAFLCEKNHRGWKIQMEKGEWPKGDKSLYEASTVAEPQAISEVMYKSKIPPHIKTIIFVTPPRIRISRQSSKMLLLPQDPLQTKRSTLGLLFYFYTRYT